MPCECHRAPERQTFGGRSEGALWLQHGDRVLATSIQAICIQAICMQAISIQAISMHDQENEDAEVNSSPD